MVWHVHFKDGKFNIWDTIEDKYLIEVWVNSEDIEEIYAETAAEDARSMAITNIVNAKKDGCSALRSFRCDLT